MESEFLIQKYKEVKSQHENLKTITNFTLRKNKAMALGFTILQYFFKKDAFLNENPEIQTDLDLIVEYLKNVTVGHESNLHALAKSFIERHLLSLKISDIKLTAKRAGVQSGLIASVSYTNDIVNELVVSKFYIKSHQEGGITGSSVASKPVVIQELFAYKALENLGLGPKIDFFFDCRDPVREFYIASLEAGSNLLGPYDEVKPVNIPFTLAKDYSVNEVLNQTIEEKYRQLDKKLFECLKKELTLVDILSRIFSLTDCSTNSSNFGFIESNNQLSAIVIDFRVCEFNINPNIFKAFCSGNEQFNYINDSLFRHIMMNENKLKLDRSVIIMRKLKSDLFNEKIDKSERDIVEFISNCGDEHLSKYLKEEISKLQDYAESIKQNFDIFSANLDEKFTNLN